MNLMESGKWRLVPKKKKNEWQFWIIFVPIAGSVPGDKRIGQLWCWMVVAAILLLMRPLSVPTYSRLQAKNKLWELAGINSWPGGRTLNPRNMKVRTTSARSGRPLDRARTTWLHCSSSSAYSSRATKPSFDPVCTRRDGTSRYRRPRHRTPSQRQSRVAVNSKTKARRVGCWRDNLTNSAPCKKSYHHQILDHQKSSRFKVN